jgi:L-rhamnose-H+ transport protein
LIREWSGVSKKTKTTITVGIATIMLSVIVVGIGNALKV